MEITTEQLFAKIGAYQVENDMLRQQVHSLTQELAKYKHVDDADTEVVAENADEVES